MSLFRDILLMETGFLTILVSPLILFKSSNQDRYGTISKINIQSYQHMYPFPAQAPCFAIFI